MKKQLQLFRARLEKGTPALGWTVVRIPFDPAEVWPERVRSRVTVSIEGVSFRSSLFADATLGGLVLLVNKAMQKAARAGLGDTVAFSMEPDLDPRPAELPEELEPLLEDAEGLRAFYDGLSESMRRQIAKWIDEVKSESSRQLRAMQMAERLMSTMEAEVELPPAIRKAFQQNTKAATGWSRMTPTQRRAELMAVFSYLSPESRQKRILKLCALAAKKA